MALGIALSGIHNMDESQINEIDHTEDSAAQREDTMNTTMHDSDTPGTVNIHSRTLNQYM